MSGKQYTIKQGESVESIAHAAGFFWKTVWDAPENAELRRLRKSPHVVHPGDIVFVPAPEARSESLRTGCRHVIRRVGVPSKLTIRFLVNGQPRANAAYTFVIDGQKRTGTTDGDGWLRESVDPVARRAEVRFAIMRPSHTTDSASELDDVDDEDPRRLVMVASKVLLEDIFVFDLRHLDPSSELSGIRGRLRLLGYTVELEGELDDKLRSVLRAFQAEHELQMSGEPDEATCAKLVEYTHG